MPFVNRVEHDLRTMFATAEGAISLGAQPFLALLLRRHFPAAPMVFGKATPGDILGVLSQMMPISEILPRVPKIAERTTGQVMGECAEEMARRNEISREAQDEFAVRSHHRAAAAIAAGRMACEITPVKTPGGKWIHADNIVRADTSVERLAKLKPVFDPRGSVTAGNSSGRNDGAAALLVMAAEKAEALGIRPMAKILAVASSGCDPTIMGIVMLSAILIIVGNLLADIAYAIVDPRIRYEKK